MLHSDITKEFFFLIKGSLLAAGRGETSAIRKYVLFYSYERKPCLDFFCPILAAGGPHQSGQRDKYLHHSQRVPGTGNPIQSEFPK